MYIITHSRITILSFFADTMIFKKCWCLNKMYICFQSFSVHLNGSVLMEMFVCTVGRYYAFIKQVDWLHKTLSTKTEAVFHFSRSLCKWQIPSCGDWRQRLLFSGHVLLFSGHRHSYFLEISILVLLVPSDADMNGTWMEH